MKKLDTTSIILLGSRKQLLFGLVLVERALHLYRLFDEAWETRGLQSLNDCIESLYRVCAGEESAERVTSHAVHVEAAIPDTDEYGGFEASLAQAIAISLDYCLHFTTSGQDALNIEYCCQKIFEVVDIINCEQDSEATEEQVLQIELEIQSELLARVGQFPDAISQAEIEQARQLSRQFLVDIH